jgi:hypothetical protein
MGCLNIGKLGLVWDLGFGYWDLTAADMANYESLNILTKP